MFPRVIGEVIAGYAGKQVLRDWVPVDKLRGNELSKNPLAMDLLVAYPCWMNYLCLSANPGAMDWLREHKHLVEYSILANPHEDALRFAQDEMELDVAAFFFKDRAFTRALCENPNATEIMRAFLDHAEMTQHALEFLQRNLVCVDWAWLSTNPKAMPLLELHVRKIDWEKIWSNPGAVDFLERLFVSNKQEWEQKVNWTWLSRNPHPRAIRWLGENLSNVDWRYLSANPGAMPLLLANPKRIDWNSFSINPAAPAEMLRANLGLLDCEWLGRNPQIFEAKTDPKLVALLCT